MWERERGTPTKKERKKEKSYQNRITREDKNTDCSGEDRGEEKYSFWARRE